MLECIDILRHGLKSHLQDDWCMTLMSEHHYAPNCGIRSDNVGNRYFGGLNFVMCWIAYRSPSETLPSTKPAWELTNCDPDGFESTGLGAAAKNEPTHEVEKHE